MYDETPVSLRVPQDPEHAGVLQLHSNAGACSSGKSRRRDVSNRTVKVLQGDLHVAVVLQSSDDFLQIVRGDIPLPLQGLEANTAECVNAAIDVWRTCVPSLESVRKAENAHLSGHHNGK